ncbi:MAG: hypothetical protein II650_02980 [Clostridia bacterium]|nr:hypothetical protein [Clostridia bacterium]MBQ4351148.1 hypothetical protein [Clostridia bacterium]
MFQIQPVRSRELQEQLAQAVGAPYYPDTFSFFAAELTDDAQAITGILGLCQFTYAPDEAVIRSVAAMPGSEDDEAIIVMVRAVMSFLNHAEIPFVFIEEDAAPAERIKRWGFRPLKTDPAGRLGIDLEKFYTAVRRHEEQEAGSDENA